MAGCVSMTRRYYGYKSVKGSCVLDGESTGRVPRLGTCRGRTVGDRKPDISVEGGRDVIRVIGTN